MSTAPFDTLSNTVPDIASPLSGFVSPGAVPATQASFPSTDREAYLWAKRGLDVVVSFLMLVILAPLMGAISVLVAIDGGPVLFRHVRCGQGGADFTCLKFRTMITDAEDAFEEYLSFHPEVVREWRDDRKLRFDPRVTAIGRFLRRSSLDELPQLVNVLRGEMSLVGPRPVTDHELPLYGSRLGLYRSVKPGLTGLWQVSGRNDLDFDARVALDERYVLGRCMRSDLSILLRTPGIVLGRAGAR